MGWRFTYCSKPVDRPPVKGLIEAGIVYRGKHVRKPQLRAQQVSVIYDEVIAMYNEAIVNAPVTLFLGAGASKPFGKMLMGEFIFYLENQRGFQSRTFFREIVGVPEGRDLEHLFEELDEWSRKGYYEADPAGVAPIRGLTLGRSESPREIVGGLAREATDVLRDLRKEVFAAYRELCVPHLQIRSDGIQNMLVVLDR